uniref:Uncharacterized protein n=1 Tax=Panagrolaimus superbus TaxID=310955 RepID=A0A914Z595_9BILA
MGYFGRNSKKQHIMCLEVLYQSTFKCVTTNLRAECKSLRAFENNGTKNDAIYETKSKIFVDNFEKETSTVAVVINQIRDETQKAGVENGFFITKRELYIVIVTFFLTIVGIAIILLCCLAVIRIMKKENRPNQNLYWGTQQPSQTNTSGCEIKQGNLLRDNH